MIFIILKSPCLLIHTVIMGEKNQIHDCIDRCSQPSYLGFCQIYELVLQNNLSLADLREYARKIFDLINDEDVREMHRVREPDIIIDGSDNEDDNGEVEERNDIIGDPGEADDKGGTLGGNANGLVHH